MQSEFTGTARYRPLRPLGAGGMGRVYAVQDTEQDRTVALKTLGRTDPLAFYLF